MGEIIVKCFLQEHGFAVAVRFERITVESLSLKYLPLAHLNTVPSHEQSIHCNLVLQLKNPGMVEGLILVNPTISPVSNLSWIGEKVLN